MRTKLFLMFAWWYLDRRLTKFYEWRAFRRHQRHIRWLRKARVVLHAPNPRAVIYRRWNVPN